MMPFYQPGEARGDRIRIEEVHQPVGASLDRIPGLGPERVCTTASLPRACAAISPASVLRDSIGTGFRIHARSS